jgi:predicted nucleic acid-binding protein
LAGLTLDSGALIAVERADRRAMAHLKEALQRGAELTVPTVVIAETWRGGAKSARVARLLRACRIDPLTDEQARAAGEAMAAIRKASTIDAIVMASASARRDRVLASDVDDLTRLRAYFPEVTVLRV